MEDSVLSHLSILIVTYKGDDLLSNCLASLKYACGDFPEIVVVDNSANSKTQALVGEFTGAKYVSSRNNLGYAGGNNLGLPFCSRPYVLLLNNDTIIHEEPFSLLIRYLQDHSDVAVVQGTMNIPNLGNVLDSCGAMLMPIGELYFLHDHQLTAEAKRETRPVFAVKGACLLFKKKVIDDLGGVLFHGHFMSYYEDVDFCHRVWLIGYEVHFVDTPTIDHLLGQTSNQLDSHQVVIQYLANLLFSHLTLLDRHGLICIMPRLALWYACILFRRLLAWDWGLIWCFAKAFQKTYEKRNEILIIRQNVSKARKLTDRDLFTKILFRPPFRYYYLMLRGRKGEFSAN